MKGALNVQLQGLTAANRDAVITLKNQATGATIERKPFLDGSLLIRDLEPGPYEIEVRHPNLILPIDKRLIRVFPQSPPIFVPVPVPPDLFRDTPIRDIADADLGPVQQAASLARERLAPLGSKSSGEVIRAADWNTLVGVVSDLASAIGELTRLVSPRGHDHPEIADKISEVQENLRRFAESFGRGHLELRREIETEDLRKKLADVLDKGGASEEVRKRIGARVDELTRNLQGDTPLFTQKLSLTGTLLLNEVNQLAVAKGAGADDFLVDPSVKALKSMAESYAATGVQTRAESELGTYSRSSAATGGKKLGSILGG